MHEYELYHFGVKGMHWGIRKDPYSGYNRIKRPKKIKSSKKFERKRISNKSNRVSQKQAVRLATKKSGLTKEQKIAIGAAIGAAVIIGGSIYLSHKNDKIGGFNYSNYVDSGSSYSNKFIANLGPMPLHRISPGKESSEDIMGRPFYASYRPSDVIKYRSQYTDQLRRELKGQDYVEEKLIQVKGGKINVADESDGAKVFDKAMKTDPEFVTKMRDFFNDDRILDYRTRKEYGWDPDTQQMPHDGWYRLLIDRNGHGAGYDKLETAKKALFDKLKESGYQAVVDSHDVHNSYYNSKKPLIVFDPSSVVKSVKEKQVSDRAKKVADGATLVSDLVTSPILDAQILYYNTRNTLAKTKDNAKKRAKVARYTLDYLKNLE